MKLAVLPGCFGRKKVYARRGLAFLVEVRSWFAKWRAARDARRSPREADPLWSPALAYGRASATALTLAVFVAGLTLDDLHLLRFSVLYPAMVIAVGVFAFAPPLFASRLLARLAADAHPDPLSAVERAVIRRRALWGISIALLIVWLVLFASGRTPRW